ncbi:MAG: CPBP family glutamic-type intramembrane protease [Clostridium sp.]|nr:CPBP family glutamic-type intramembrane protease [Clostridium sp.]MCI6692143.1 CPBP family glutamic-type intramembrane protease [Clostridium sp.]MDY6227251.1 CPBP family glutamic-type intramembrane protease [Clostridium sp.]
MNIMFWKVITGISFGIVVGFFRYKNKNVYSSMIVHALLNTFGS